MIYKKIITYCKENDLTICKFESMCALGNGIVGRWKNNSSLPSLKTLNKIVNATGLPLEYWIGEIQARDALDKETSDKKTG